MGVTHEGVKYNTKIDLIPYLGKAGGGHLPFFDMVK